jgi:VanZ family protein
MVLLFVLSSLPSSEVPSFGLFDTLLKKGGHFLGYAFLSLAYLYALPQQWSLRTRGLVAVVLAVLYALSDEYHQSFTPGRRPSLLDVGIDTLGAATAMLLVARYSPNSNSKSSSSSES